MTLILFADCPEDMELEARLEEEELAEYLEDRTRVEELGQPREALQGTRAA